MLRRVVALGVVQGHVELVTESGVVSVVGTCQREVELHGIRCNEWSRMAALVMACQRVMEPHGIRCSEWSKVVALVVAHQRVGIRRLKLGWDV